MVGPEASPGQSRDTPPGWIAQLQTIRDINTKLHSEIVSALWFEMCLQQIPDATELYNRTHPLAGGNRDPNQPLKATAPQPAPVNQILEIAQGNLSAEFIDTLIARKIKEHNVSHHFEVFGEEPPLTMLRAQFARWEKEGCPALTSERERAVKVALTQQLLTTDLAVVNAVAELLSLDYFSGLINRIAGGPNSLGKIGGKGAGTEIAIEVLLNENFKIEGLGAPRSPKAIKTRYLATDLFSLFEEFNEFSELLSHKFQPPEYIRQTYPGIVALYKHSPFPPEMVEVLRGILADFGDRRLIVRSTSLLEDRLGSAFSGKYKSLFLLNNEDFETNLKKLMDAVSEVYASTHSPDALDYRRERGLLNFNEKMGIKIDAVVGAQLGDYYFPAFAGVAFSRNEMPWPGVSGRDGVVRIVPGLGTRAVDRISDDYAQLICPAKPDRRPNTSFGEIVQYATSSMQVMNLAKRGSSASHGQVEQDALEVVRLVDVLRKHPESFPLAHFVFSHIDFDQIKPIRLFGPSVDPANMLATFRGDQSEAFFKSIKRMLDILEKKLGVPVDVEFACDGEDFYLLQCRPHNVPAERAPAKIPRHISRENLLFSANKHIHNGEFSNIEYIIYIDPAGYKGIKEEWEFKAVVVATEKSNSILPARQFILMGPGRFCSSDPFTGVQTPSRAISNALVIVEICRADLGYQPDLSLGAHNFNDIIERKQGILGLYPDKDGHNYNWNFFDNSRNELVELAPEHRDIAHIVKVFRAPPGTTISVLMNAEEQRAVCILVPESK